MNHKSKWHNNDMSCLKDKKAVQCKIDTGTCCIDFKISGYILKCMMHMIKKTQKLKK